MPQDDSQPTQLPAAHQLQPGGATDAAGALDDDLTPPQATATERTARIPGGFGSQLPATRDTATASGIAASPSAGAVASSGMARGTEAGPDERASLAEASMSIANTEIQSTVGTEPSLDLHAIPATELQNPIGFLEPPDTAPATIPDTVPQSESMGRCRRLHQGLDTQLAAPALASAHSDRGAQGTPATDVYVTPLTDATAPGDGAAGATDRGEWGRSGRARARSRHTIPGSSGGAARTPHLGGASEAGSERPRSGGTAIQEDADTATPGTQPTPLLTQVEPTEEPAAGLGSFGVGEGGSVGGSLGASDHDRTDTAVGGPDEGAAEGPAEGLQGSGAAASALASDAAEAVRETPSASGASDGEGDQADQARAEQAGVWRTCQSQCVAAELAEACAPPLVRHHVLARGCC